MLDLGFRKTLAAADPALLLVTSDFLRWGKYFTSFPALDGVSDSSYRKLRIRRGLGQKYTPHEWRQTPYVPVAIHILGS